MNTKSNYYQIYINKVLQLAETILIKSEETAEALNRMVDDHIAIYGGEGTNTLDPTTWKYYLNISGEYHPIDEPMYVVSLDTLEKIKFSRENLYLHRATARGYAYGTRHYQELVAQYPQQEMLILGILYPVDIDEAIAAPDGKILGYAPGLVEPNEYSLVRKLQDWIDGYKKRWVNRQFGISDELYPATALGIMYLNLVPAILNLRLEACKTNEAHSFHVRQYLASHGLLDAYIDQMTTKQALFFYRNIAYIERNVGKRDIFNWLVEHIMTERSLPLAEYTMRHDLTNQPDELYPALTFRRTPVNMGYSSDLTDNITLRQILDKQDTLARDNGLYKPEVLPQIQEVMENSLSNVVQTKMLESSVIDHTNSSPYTMEDILLNHWLYLSASDRYTAFIGVTNPRTGERIPLTVKEAYTFLWYAFAKSIGIELTTVPEVLAKRVQRIPEPPKTYASLSAAAVTTDPNPPAGSVEDLMSIVDPEMVDRELAVLALSMQPTIDNVISTEAFYELCQQIYAAAQMQRNLVASQEHCVVRGMVFGMISRIYSDNVVQLEAPNTAYAEWFNSRNINVDEFTSDDLRAMYKSLIEEATGMALSSTTSLADMQAAMIKMLTQLSSYSIQIVGQINSTEIKQTDWTAVRVGNVDCQGRMLQLIPGMNVRSGNYLASATQRSDFAVMTVEANKECDLKASAVISLELAKPYRMASIGEIFQYRVEAIRTRVQPQVTPSTNARGIVPVMGIDAYMQLPLEQQQDFRDVYNGGYNTLMTPDDSITLDPGTNVDTMYMMPRYVTPNYSF